MRIFISLLLVVCCVACYKADNSGMYSGVPIYEVSLAWKDSTAKLHEDTIMIVPVHTDTTLYFQLHFNLIRGMAEKYVFHCDLSDLDNGNLFFTDTASFQLGYTLRNTFTTGHFAVDDTIRVTVSEQESGASRVFSLVFRVR